MANYTQSFNENGYVVVPSIFKQSEIKKIKKVIPEVTKKLKNLKVDIFILLKTEDLTQFII